MSPGARLYASCRCGVYPFKFLFVQGWVSSSLYFYPFHHCSSAQPFAGIIEAPGHTSFPNMQSCRAGAGCSLKVIFSRRTTAKSTPILEIGASPQADCSEAVRRPLWFEHEQLRTGLDNSSTREASSQPAASLELTQQHVPV